MSDYKRSPKAQERLEKGIENSKNGIIDDSFGFTEDDLMTEEEIEAAEKHLRERGINIPNRKK